jgi:DNA-binding PadR family transcriptional regulator
MATQDCRVELRCYRCLALASGRQGPGGRTPRSGDWSPHSSGEIVAMGAAEEIDVSEYEGSLLALTLRNQPISAHQLLKIFERSPVSSLNRSKGNVYPLIRRLKNRKLLATQAPTEGRSKEHLVCTEKGERAVRKWVNDVHSDHILLNDPLRTRIISFSLLNRNEQIDNVQSMVATQMDFIEKYNAAISIPFQEMVYSNTMKALSSRMTWLSEIRKYIHSLGD